MKMLRLTLIGLSVLMLLVMTACGGGDTANNTSNNGSTETGDQTTTGDSGDSTEPSSAPAGMTISGELQLDPALVALDDADSLLLAGYLYEGLVRLQGDGTIGEGIASGWDVSDDGLSYQFTLRSDAMFSDGTPITADVILANFNRWFDPANPLHGSDSQVYKGWLAAFKGFRGEVDSNQKPISLFDGIEKVDNLTVLIHIFEPMPNFLEIVAQPYFSILNTQALGDGYGTLESGVVSSGPYVVGELTESGFTLVSNASYWGVQPEEALEFSFE